MHGQKNIFITACFLIKGHVHQGTFRQFITYNGCKQQIACKFQATHKQLVAYNTCTLTLMVVKSFVCY